MIDVVFHIVLILWLALTFLNQFFNLKKIRKYDYFNLITGWKLFTPNPIGIDFKICYRDKLKNGNVSELVQFEPKYVLIYHRRDMKALIEICNSLKVFGKKERNRSRIKLHLHYKILSGFIKYHDYSDEISERQIVGIEHNSITDTYKQIFVAHIEY